MKRLLLLTVLVVIVAAGSGRAEDAAAAEMRRVVGTAEHPWLRWPRFPDYQDDSERLYESTGWSPVWCRDGGPTRQATEVIASFRQADAHGLRPTDYDPDRLADEAKRVSPSDPATLALFDAALTVSTMRYVSDAYVGRVNPRTLGFGLDVEPKKLDLVAVVTELAQSPKPGQQLAGFDPPFPLFRRLQAELPKMRVLAARSDLRPLPTPLPVLRPGDTDPSAPVLRQRLALLGDLADDTATDPTVYDAGLVAGVKRFQERHGLAADGVIGPATARALRVQPAMRVQQIELAMERLRWLPLHVADRFILVNLPQFRLFGFRAGVPGPRIAMAVVVGSAARRNETPILHADLEHVVFRPHWHVPPGIAEKEILPKVRRDPGYLERHHMDMVDSRVRQRPGRDNALGLVKFIFPNEHGVYMHDTPQKSLFGRAQRDFSHGCIRVADPVGLAEFVLGWDRARIVQAMQRGRDNRWVAVPEPIPVYLLYSTAVVDESGRLYFFEDLYGHDAELARAVARGHPYPQ